MQIILSELNNFGILPSLHLHPEAAGSLLDFERTRGGQMRLTPQCAISAAHLPGYSPHDFGLAIDLDVDEMQAQYGLSKTGLDALMEQHGWYCHRRDGQRGPHDNHYNYLGMHPEEYLARAGVLTTAGAIEALILSLYGDDMGADRTQAFLHADKLIRPATIWPEPLPA